MARVSATVARVLVTGIGSSIGTHAARALERYAEVEAIVGIDTSGPRAALARTEYVPSDPGFAVVQRIIKAERIDTVLHLQLALDPKAIESRSLHEHNVIRTLNLLAAAGTPGSTVRKVVVRSSTQLYGSHHDDPYFFSEDTPRRHGPRTPVERSLLGVMQVVREFGEDNPHVVVTTLRFADVLGIDATDAGFSRLLRRRLVPEIAGYDPRLQFVHDNDVSGALVHATLHDVPGDFNVAGEGTLPWSEVCAIVGKRRVPIPPVLTRAASAPVRALRLAELPSEALALLRYGRAVDNRRYQTAGFRYRFTTAGAVDAFARGLRVRHAPRGVAAS